MFNLERNLARLFALDEQTWLRHANPWSVFTRTSVLPLLAVSVWSRVALGWYALLPVGVSVLWMWLNPRLFGKPRTTTHWASRAVFGERVWINRDEVPVPERHRSMPHVLNGLSAAGTLVAVWGLWALHAWATVSGILLAILAKYWFLDRMVWLFDDMKQHEPYASMLY